MSGFFDFNDADHQQNGFDLIPAKTVLPLVMSIRPGGAGDNGWLRLSQSTDAEMLDCEFTVESGPYAKRKVWQMFTVSGGKLDDKGESIGAKISRQSLRAILESARGINPDDMSEYACQGRRINGWEDFNGIVFWARIGVEKDKTGHYEDKNKITCVITPDMKEYGKMSEAPAKAPAASGWGAAPVSSQAAWAPRQETQNGQSRGGNPAPANPAPQPSENATPTPAWAR